MLLVALLAFALWHRDRAQVADKAMLARAIAYPALVFAVLAASTQLPRWAIAGRCAGAGAITAIGWELAEYLTFVTHTDEQFTIYRDTIGDLVLGLAGSACAGLLCAFAVAPIDSLRGRRRARLAQ